MVFVGLFVVVLLEIVAWGPTKGAIGAYQIIGTEVEERDYKERPGKEWTQKHNSFAKKVLLNGLATQEDREVRLRGHFIDALQISPRVKSSLLLHWELSRQKGGEPEENDYVWDLSQKVGATKKPGDLRKI